MGGGFPPFFLLFQFHKVQLKEEAKIYTDFLGKFQFHKVQLKA